MKKKFQGRNVEFLLVYVREAHPGEHYPAHTSLEQKKQHARALAEQEDIHTTVIIDDLEGTIHRSYGLQPNMLYVIDKAGRVAFRALWAEEAALRRTLTALLDRERKGQESTFGENLNILIPFLHGMSEIPRVLGRAGPQAVEDLQHVLGPRAWLAARAISPLRPLLRTSRRLRAALLGGLALGMLAVILAALRRRQQQGGRV
ncbi:MAG: hypothetical protein ACE5G5_04890 [Candidatus Methylomirabilales bacterium]